MIMRYRGRRGETGEILRMEEDAVGNMFVVLQSDPVIKTVSLSDFVPSKPGARPLYVIEDAVL